MGLCLMGRSRKRYRREAVMLCGFWRAEDCNLSQFLNL